MISREEAMLYIDKLAAAGEISFRVQTRKLEVNGRGKLSRRGDDISVKGQECSLSVNISGDVNFFYEQTTSAKPPKLVATLMVALPIQTTLPYKPEELHNAASTDNVYFVEREND